MNYSDLLRLTSENPVFETTELLAGNINPKYLRKQLNEWIHAGRIQQLRRGLYVLAEPYRKIVPHPFLIANRLQPASYVSLQSALAYYEMIPEAVHLTTSVTTGRPREWNTPLGSFKYHHVQKAWFQKYDYIEMDEYQFAFIAKPEKALLDLILLVPGSDSMDYLRELRLENLERLDLNLMKSMAPEKPKLKRAVATVEQLINERKAGIRPL